MDLSKEVMDTIKTHESILQYNFTSLTRCKIDTYYDLKEYLDKLTNLELGVSELMEFVVNSFQSNVDSDLLN